MYDGVGIDRHLYSSGDLTILYDDIVSEEEHGYQQLFHLSSDLRKVSSNSEEVLLQIGNTGYTARIWQMLPTELTEFRGRKDGTPLYGYKSERFNTAEEIDTLRYEVQAHHGKYITVISIEDSEGSIRLKNGTKIKASDVAFHEDTNEISFGKELISLTSRKRIYPKGKAFVEDGNILLVKTAEQEDCQYAVYIISIQKGRVIHKTGYSKERIFLFDLTNQEEDAIVRLYARSLSTPQKKQAIIAALVCKGKGEYQVDDGTKYPHLNLCYHGHHMEELGGISIDSWWSVLIPFL